MPDGHSACHMVLGKSKKEGSWQGEPGADRHTQIRRPLRIPISLRCRPACGPVAVPRRDGAVHFEASLLCSDVSWAGPPSCRGGSQTQSRLMVPALPALPARRELQPVS